MHDAIKNDLKQFIQNGVNSMTRIEGEKGYLSELAEEAKEKFEISKKDFNARVRTAFDKMKMVEKRDELNEAIEDIEGMGF